MHRREAGLQQFEATVDPKVCRRELKGERACREKGGQEERERERDRRLVTVSVCGKARRTVTPQERYL